MTAEKIAEKIINSAKSLNLTKVAVLIAGAFILYVVYYTFIMLPEKKLAQAKAETERKESKMRICMMIASNDYDTSWESNCDMLNRGKDCALPVYLADDLNEVLKDDKDRCVKTWN